MWYQNSEFWGQDVDAFDSRKTGKIWSKKWGSLSSNKQAKLKVQFENANKDAKNQKFFKKPASQMVFTHAKQIANQYSTPIKML